MSFTELGSTRSKVMAACHILSAFIPPSSLSFWSFIVTSSRLRWPIYPFKGLWKCSMYVHHRQQPSSSVSNATSSNYAVVTFVPDECQLSVCWTQHFLNWISYSTWQQPINFSYPKLEPFSQGLTHANVWLEALYYSAVYCTKNSCLNVWIFDCIN